MKLVFSVGSYFIFRRLYNSLDYKKEFVSVDIKKQNEKYHKVTLRVPIANVLTLKKL